MRISIRLTASLKGVLSALLVWTLCPGQAHAIPAFQTAAYVPAEMTAFSAQSRAKPAAKKAAPRPASKAAPKKTGPARPEARRGADKPTIPPRQDFTAEEQDHALIPGIADARFWADSPKAFTDALPASPGPWLVISTGGSDGAYGAGVLAGWGAAGTRPEFSVVTGVSTGALMAPYVFVGGKYDEQLRAAYTTINATDIFEIGGKGESLLDTWPLKDLVAKRVTKELLADIAAEHARGRRLFVLTTNLDAGRPVAWNIGAIASKGDQQALELVRDILVAATSIPGAFPPVLIQAQGGPDRFHEMHVDGGLSAQFYVAPDALQANASTYRLPATDLYVIVNMKLGNDFQVTERSTLSILGRTVAAAIRGITRNALDRAYTLAKRSEVPFHVAVIDEAFHAPSRGPFDPDYMKALFDSGFAQGKAGTAFRDEPPGFPDRPTRAAR